jgi:hypothetical protein
MMTRSQPRISQLPFRARLVLVLLYAAALGTSLAGLIIAQLRGSDPGIFLWLGLEALMIIHLVRLKLPCRHRRRIRPC